MLSWTRLFGSTAFLIGPKRQVTMMLDPARIYATALYLASMIIALFCALYVSCTVAILLVLFVSNTPPPPSFRVILKVFFIFLGIETGS